MNNLRRYTLYIENITDIAALILSFAAAYLLRFYVFQSETYSPQAYLQLLLAMIVAYIILDIAYLGRSDFLGRNAAAELRETFISVSFTTLSLLVYVFFTKTNDLYSRIFIFTFALIAYILMYLLRTFVRRKILPLYRTGKGAEKVVVIGTRSDVNRILRRFARHPDWRIRVVGLVITDEDCKGQYIEEIPVVSNFKLMLVDLVRLEADSCLLATDLRGEELEWLMNVLTDMGKVVHLNIQEFDLSVSIDRAIDYLGGCAVVSYMPINPLSGRQAFLKRVLDILLALILMPLLLVTLAVTALAYKIESPGPLFIDRIRIGKNGRRYYQHRFRVLYTDAERRMNHGENGYTKWGSFLNRSHLARLPQIINVLYGDMSFIGPHSPSLVSFLNYAPEKRKNLTIKPGIMGLWSCEDDPDNLIENERSYVEKWSLRKDIWLLTVMILRYITFQASPRLNMHYSPEVFAEELAFLKDYQEEQKPLVLPPGTYSAPRDGKAIGYAVVKRAFDIVGSLAAIIVLSPLMLVLSIVIMTDDGGSALYGHPRIGKDGRRIRVLKFRSMRQDAGDLKKLLTPEQLEQYSREFKVDNDPRITDVGNFLRRTSLDELPQLFNILGGSMSFVGPRPIVEEETTIYGSDIRKLLSVKPGLTGYWQAFARNLASYESGERQEMEMYYIDHQSVGFDLKILLKTVGAVAKMEGAK